MVSIPNRVLRFLSWHIQIGAHSIMTDRVSIPDRVLGFLCLEFTPRVLAGMAKLFQSLIGF